MNGFCYITENESKGGALGWNKSNAGFVLVYHTHKFGVNAYFGPKITNKPLPKTNYG